MNKILKKYPHISFRKKWKLNEETIYELGQCFSIIKALEDTPVEPEDRKMLLMVSLKKSAQATTAIEGNTLSDEEIDKVERGTKLPPSKEYMEIEVRNILNAQNILLKEITFDNLQKIIQIDLIKRFNKLVGKDLGDYFNAIPGRIRKNNVLVGNYRPPDYEDAELLLKKFCEWSIK